MSEHTPDLAPLLKAMNEVMKVTERIRKTGTNDFHKYSYASEEDALKEIRPHLTEHGLLLIPSLDGDPDMDQHGNTHVRMAYTLAHVSGAVWPEKLIFPGCGNDRAKNGTIGDKGVYKAMTGANKYMLFKTFQLPTGDDPEIASAHDKGAAKASPPAARKAAEPAQNGSATPVEEIAERFYAQDSYHIKVPMNGNGDPDYLTWAGKYATMVGFTPSVEAFQKLQEDNQGTRDFCRDKCAMVVKKRVNDAEARRTAFYSQAPMETVQ